MAASHFLWPGLLVATAVATPTPSSSCDETSVDAVPRGLHLAFSGGDPANEVVVSWFSCGLPPSAPNPVVEVFATEHASNGTLYTGKSHGSYKRWQHNVVVDGLAPGTAYFFKARRGVFSRGDTLKQGNWSNWSPFSPVR